MTIDEWGAGELSAKVDDKHGAPLTKPQYVETSNVPEGVETDNLPEDVEIVNLLADVDIDKFEKKNVYINSLDVSFNNITYICDKPFRMRELDPSFAFKRPLDRLRVQFSGIEISSKHLI
ncbi:hypothetical protein [Pandoraea sputorum]|uniref:hypothetical protein n=1 Tax=Pandoraea sputorum TaxID=93222 RepID=UPI001241FEEA|nr:hypothetical protein [Pandoraea sputorum]